MLLYKCNYRLPIELWEDNASHICLSVIPWIRGIISVLNLSPPTPHPHDCTGPGPTMYRAMTPQTCLNLFNQSSGGSRISPRRGRQLPGGRQHMILPKFSKNCMKLKEFGPPGGARPLCPLRSATAEYPEVH